MKRHLITYGIILWLSKTAFTQNIVKNDTLQYSETSITLQQSDTVFYEYGKIKYITFYHRPVYTIGNSLMSTFELQKKVYQYDKCGNLRNITEINRYIGQITSCHDHYFNHPYQVKDNFITNVECTEPWTKPLIIF